MKLKEVGSLCLAPVVLVGYLFASDLRTQVSKPTSASTGTGQMLEVQTCESGLGLDAKASTNGLYGMDVQYGLTYRATDNMRVTFTPKLGISYVDHPVKELSQTTQYGLGGQLTLGYKDFRVGAELWHLSNGNRTIPNIGLNMIAIQTGWVF